MRATLRSGKRSRGILRLALATAASVGACASPILADITPTGSTDLTSGNYYVGHHADGTLGIDGGSVVTNSNGYLGFDPACTGTATVSGAGSSWSNSSALYVGYGGSGRLGVSDGAQVTANTLYASPSDLAGNGTITARGVVLDTAVFFDTTHGTTQNLAFGSGGTLTLTVDGTGDLGAGYRGTGTLRIADGLTVASNNGYLGHMAGSSGTATVSGIGSTWSTKYGLCVGNGGSGTLNIQAGAQVVTDSGGTMSGSYLGLSSGSSGTATVTGTGSTLATSLLFVGDRGTGTLNVQTGGCVTSTICWLGYISDSSGAATVTGPNSAWTNTDGLYVGGYEGSGTLTVSDGGAVSTTSLYASPSGLLGNGTITARGVVLDTDVFIDATHGPTQTMTFGSGGALNLIVDGTGELGAGYRGIGNLRIADGRSVASVSGMLGRGLGSSGTATVSGPGSAWAISDAFYVGHVASGTLRVERGAQVSVNGTAYIGAFGSASSGSATVTGSGSVWSNSQSLYVGNEGDGTLTVSDGGVVTARTLYAPASALFGNGTIRASGAVLDANVALGAVAGQSQSVPFGSGGTLALTLDGTGDFGVGYKGVGTLRIGNGLAVASNHGYLGYSAGANGSATVADGSHWTNTSDLDVGSSGAGVLRIEASGQVSNGRGYIALQSASTGTVTVCGTGSQWSNSYLYVGFSGSGALSIEAGGQVRNSNYGYIAFFPTSNSIVTVTGKDAKWIASSYLYVGYGGNGALTIEDGGEVSNRLGYIGSSSNSSGIVTVRGVGSRWTHGTSTLTIGDSGSGALAIEAGGQVINGFGYIAYRAGSTGAATVSGTGSAWNNSSALYVGSSGTGLLSVSDGGKVTATNLSVNTQSAVRLRITGNSMIVLGTASAAATLTNNGTINLYADQSLSPGTYKPISDAGKGITWSGTGTYNAFGGTWSPTAHTFTVVSPTTLDAGFSDSAVAPGERYMITDSARGKRIAAAFGSVAANTNFRADWMTEPELASLATMNPTGSVLSAWDFTTNFTGGEVLLSMDIGQWAQDPQVWHLHNGVWSLYTDGTPIYDGNGFLSFTATEFSGYAVTAAVPEPSVLSLLAAGALGFLRRRRRA